MKSDHNCNFRIKIILSRPRNPDNIGAAARAMANFGLEELALAAPHLPAWRETLETSATAGSGDVLAGMIGGLLGQKLDPFQGTLLGVFMHSLAGDLAATEQGHRSMTAGDIIRNIGNAFKKIKNINDPAMPVEGRARLR